jgi:hypothetical protein
MESLATILGDIIRTKLRVRREIILTSIMESLHGHYHCKVKKDSWNSNIIQYTERVLSDLKMQLPFTALYLRQYLAI